MLSAVARVERRYPNGPGITLTVRMLHGSGEQRIRQLGLDTFSTYGIMRDTDRMRIREYIDVLTEQGYLTQTTGKYPVLFTTERAWAVLRGKERVVYSARHEPSTKPAGKRRRDIRSDGRNKGLYEALRNLRTDPARAEGVILFFLYKYTLELTGWVRVVTQNPKIRFRFRRHIYA